MSEILNPDGTYKPVKEWPAPWQRMVISFKVKPVHQRSQDGKDSAWVLVGYEYEFRFERGGNVWKLIGDHVGVRAYPTANRDVTVNITLEAIEAKLYLAREQASAGQVQDVEAKRIN